MQLEQKAFIFDRGIREEKNYLKIEKGCECTYRIKEGNHKYANFFFFFCLVQLSFSCLISEAQKVCQMCKVEGKHALQTQVFQPLCIDHQTNQSTNRTLQHCFQNWYFVVLIIIKFSVVCKVLPQQVATFPKLDLTQVFTATRCQDCQAFTWAECLFQSEQPVKCLNYVA